MIRIAIQSNGRLNDASEDFLISLGLRFERNGRCLMTKCKNADVEILFLRDDDIPIYVSRGVAEYGIVGENVLYEKKVQVDVVKKLGFARCDLVIAVPMDSGVERLSDLAGERIATTYPSLLADFLKKERVPAAIINLKGSVEAAPGLNLADAICDLSQSGRTLKENGLAPLVTLLESEAVLIKSQIVSSSDKDFNFLTRIS